MTNSEQYPAFIPGLILPEGFLHDDVEPVLRSHFADLRYSAGLIGSGSEVLEFDKKMSSDIFSDNTDMLEDSSIRPILRSLFGQT